MEYRKELDGLRAIAVISVILFHADFRFFSGGYVGVDVFFVISGYLITRIILADLKAARFSFAHFYERRVRRIVPALFLVLAASIVAGWWILLPEDLRGFSDSLFATLLFVSNIFFWKDIDYFGSNAELKPLLHTWSLAVEEQFYLIVPVILLALWRAGGGRWLGYLLALGGIVSFYLAQKTVAHQPEAAFFLTHTRAWELALGSVAALHAMNRQAAAAQEAGSGHAPGLVGLALIAYSVVAFDRTTPFPGLYALVPTVGAVLVILFAHRDTVAGRLLQIKPLVGIGLVSYSAYLWHQPLFAFARQGKLEPLTQSDYAALSLLTFVLAYMSWRFVEQPFRSARLVSRRGVMTFTALGFVSLATFSIVSHTSDGFESRAVLPAEINRSFEMSARSKACFDKDQVHTREDWLCQIGDANAAPSFILFGDSHALALMEVFDRSARQLGRSGYFAGASGCPPLLGVHALRSDQEQRNCHAFNQRVFDFIRQHQLADAFLVGRWTYYTEGGYSGVDASYLGLNPDDDRTLTSSRKAFEAGAIFTESAFATLGTRGHLLLQIPQQRVDKPQKIYQRLYFVNALDGTNLARLSVSEETNQQLQRYTNSVLARTMQRIRVISLDDVYCQDGHCPVGNPHASYYFDDDHLSVLGAYKSQSRIEALLGR